MTTMLLLLLSGVLIGTGVSLIWRDVHSKRRDAFVLSRDPKADPELEPDVEVTVSPDHADQAGLGYADMLAGVAQGIDDARAATGIESRVIVTAVRNRPAPSMRAAS